MLDNMLDFNELDSILKSKYLPRSRRIIDTYFDKNESGLRAVMLYRLYGEVPRNTCYVVAYKENDGVIFEYVSSIAIDAGGKSRMLWSLIKTLEEGFFSIQKIARAVNFLAKNGEYNDDDLDAICFGNRQT